MLRSMQLENFKAFGQRTIIPLAPITLIFGENSAGKSSILQSLNLLKQSRESRNSEALLNPRTQDGFVDLGSFQEMLFDHDLRKTLSIRLEMPFDEQRGLNRRGRFPDHKTLSVELGFVRRTLKDDVSLDRLILFSDDQQIASFAPSTPEDSKHLLPSSPYSGRYPFVLMPVLSCNELTRSETFWRPVIEDIVRNKTKIQRELLLYRHNFDHLTPSTAGEGNQVWRMINRGIKLFEGDPTPSGILAWLHKELLETVIALDRFVPVEQSPNTATVPRFESLPTLSGWAMDFGESLEQTLYALCPLGPFRMPASRFYGFTSKPLDVGYQGNRLPEYLFCNPDSVTEANEWLHRLDIGYDLTIRPLGKQVPDLFEVRLLDKRRKKGRWLA